jgi:hypothetical protein
VRGWFRKFGFREDPLLERRNASIAIIDAATIYGAGRWYFGDHKDPRWEYAKQYNADEDRVLFYDFLHNVLLYDHIILDNKSRTIVELKRELLRMFDVVNNEANEELLKEESIAPTERLEPIVDAVCQMLNTAVASRASKDLITSVRVPWYYMSREHYDYVEFSEAAHKWGMDQDLLPIALYVYRGLCYSGYANHCRNVRQVPTVYLASPGRLQALQPILSRDVMEKLQYPRQAYADLVNTLDLPEKGYDFSHLGLPAAHLSSLGLLLASNSPEEAINIVFRLRNSPQGQSVRKQWSKRIWATSSSCAVGAMNSNLIAGATIYGDVKQVLYAST